MFKITNYDKDFNHIQQSIVDNCWICYTKSGYEVGINLSVRYPVIESSSSSDSEEGIGISANHRIEYDGYEFHIEWEIPPKYVGTRSLKRVVDVEKDQIIISFIDYDLVTQVGPVLGRYDNPAKKLAASVQKLLNG